MSEERKPVQKSPLSHILGVTSDAKKRTFSEKHSERPDPKRLRDSVESEPTSAISEQPVAVTQKPAEEGSIVAKTSQEITENPGEVKNEQPGAEAGQAQGAQDSQKSPEQVPTQHDEAAGEASGEPSKEVSGEQSGKALEPEGAQTVENTAEPEQVEPIPAITIDSSNVLEAVAGLRPYVSGVEVYHPGKLLFENSQDQLNSRVWVRIPREYLSRTNPSVQRRKVWGTDVYTDDSDIVAALYHSGRLDPSSQDETIKGHATGTGDLAVAVTLLPKLLKYTGCYMNELNSRSWGSHHDGISFQIHRVVEIPAGTADYPQAEALERVRGWGAAFQQQQTPGEPTYV